MISKKLNNCPDPIVLSDEDAELLAYGWYLDVKGYVERSNGKRSKKRLHREVMERVLGRPLDRKELVDHKDGNKLNNTRDNLRLATSSQNVMNSRISSRNTSGYKGVNFQESDGKWRARITKEGNAISLGLYTDPIAAAKAYDQAAIKLHGEYAKLNFPRTA